MKSPMPLDEFADKFLGLKLLPYQKTILKAMDEAPDPNIRYNEVYDLHVSECDKVLLYRWIDGKIGISIKDGNEPTTDY